MNTSETPPDGVWFRNSPRTADTDRVTGHGVYVNERVEIQCYAWGDSVGAYANRLWYFVLNVTRPTNAGRTNNGYLNAHYVNDGTVANQIVSGVPLCGSSAPPTTPKATLAQGPAAPAGYRYAISLNGFPANTGISVSCRDSVDPGGFYTFILTTNGSGDAFTQSYCYSGDGPDHWFLANGVESNHLSWGSPAAGPPGGGGGSGTAPNQFFNRTATVNWALAHAQDRQDVDVMCTWFVSNAYWAGGFPKSATWTDSGSHGTVQQRPGTVTAWAVPEFLNYILKNFSNTWMPLGTLSNLNNAVPAAQPGDIIAYDWGHGDGISHIAIVVEIAPGQYPVVAEWGNSPYTLIYGRSFTSPYQKRGWTWSELNHKWLQDVYGGTVQAYLLHINGGVFVPSF